jgi:hypothetical protein
MCGDMLSSSWEAENKENDDWNPNDPSQMWMRKDIKAEIDKFHDTVVVHEFKDAVESKTIKEIYWCGGEPLMWKIHWESMKRIIDLGYQDSVSIRYNSNMSRINFFGMNLFDDVLSKFKYWNILASIDGAGQVGEYVRTGLQWEVWFKNMQYARKFTKSRRDLRMDLTMTMPGMVGLQGMLDTAEELDVDLLAKRVFGFDPSNLWSPMCLPRKILNRIVDDFLTKNKKLLTKHIYFFSALQDLKQKPTYEETYGKDVYQAGLKNGKETVERLDRVRGTDIKKILVTDKEVLEWWTGI